MAVLNSRTVIGILWVFTALYLQSSMAFKYEIQRMSTQVLQAESVTEFGIETVLTAIAYIGVYFLAAGAFEYANPAEKDEKRIAEIKKEISYGIWAVVANTTYACFWLYYLDPLTPWFGYYANRTYTPLDFVVNVLTYMFFFDGWFYWTHRLLHTRAAWKYIHFHHHQFLHPTAFAQDAVHPFEAVLQGAFGHHLVTLFLPMHPITHIIAGFSTAIFAIAAHDGRQYDVNDHCRHHTHKHVNFGLYWGLWDYICGTRYSDKAPLWEKAYKTLDE